MKAFLLLFVVFAFFATAHADEKIDAIIDVLAIETEFNAAIEELKPFEPSLREPEGANAKAYAEMSSRHHHEMMDLFDKYVSWEVIRPNITSAIKKTYSDEEIDAFYEFARTEHGASFFGKSQNFGQLFSEAFAAIYTSYAQEMSLLQKKHKNETDEFFARLEHEENHQENVPPDDSAAPTIRDIVRFMVTTENGQMVGYKVSPGRNPDLFERSAFQEGDIVLSMNGIEVNEPTRVREVYEMLKFPQVHFEVRRNGRLVDFVIDIIELASIDG